MSLICILIDVSISMYKGGDSSIASRISSTLHQLDRQWHNLPGHSDFRRCNIYAFPPHEPPELIMTSGSSWAVNWKLVASRTKELAGRWGGSNPFLAVLRLLQDERCTRLIFNEPPPKQILILSDFEITIHEEHVGEYLSMIRELAEKYGVQVIGVALRGENRYVELMRDMGFQVEITNPSFIDEIMKRYCLNYL